MQHQTLMFYSTNSRIIDANLNIPLDEHGKNGMWLEKGLFVKEVNSRSLNAIFFSSLKNRCGFILVNINEGNTLRLKNKHTHIKWNRSIFKFKCSSRHNFTFFLFCSQRRDRNANILACMYFQLTWPMFQFKRAKKCWKCDVNNLTGMEGITRGTIFTTRHIAQLLIVSRLYFCTNFSTNTHTNSPEKKNGYGKTSICKEASRMDVKYTMWKSFFFIASQPRTVFMSACKHFGLNPTSNTHQWFIFLSSKHIYGCCSVFL